MVRNIRYYCFCRRCGGPKTATHTVTTGLPIGIPVFAAGSSSFRCLASGSVTYTATSTNSTNITYSLDAASIAGGNTINASTGAVSYFLLWVGTTTITATATGCGGPKTATHVVTINGAVATPVFAAGSSSARCQGAGTVTYTATATNASGITYTMDATSTSSGNSINPATGEVTYAAAWSGPVTITATAAGCGGPKNSNTYSYCHSCFISTRVHFRKYFRTVPGSRVCNVYCYCS